MERNGELLCDVCEDPMPAGPPHATSVNSEELAKLFQSLTEREPGRRLNANMDSHGNVKLDICERCKANLGIHNPS